MTLVRVVLCALVLLGACGEQQPSCELDVPSTGSFASIDCPDEFELLAARPSDASLPGTRTVKTMVDRFDEGRLYFLDTVNHPLHRGYAVDFLGWLPTMPFSDEYLSPSRRFLLGSVTLFEESDTWTYELAPYDAASAEMITDAMDRIRRNTYFGHRLVFHPTSQSQLQIADDLPDHIEVITTEELFKGISYQPLNLGVAFGEVRVLSSEELATTYISPREIVVIDDVPDDIPVVAAVVTEGFQTPLSHVNVLSQQRGSPNMALRGALEELGQFGGQRVRLEVGAFEWNVRPATQAEADAWWETRRPEPVAVVPPDVSVTSLVDIDVVRLGDLAAVGGKAAHFGELRQIPELRVRAGFAIPMYYYHDYMASNGLDVELATMLADDDFWADGVKRRMMLQQFREQITAAAISPAVLAEIESEVDARFPSTRMRFRSSTNAEDLRGFSGAGLYDSKSGAVGDTQRPVESAVKAVWASLWNFRAFEEREFAGIDHEQVAMAILVHPTYIDETANGVAITANIFDPSATGEDAFFINVQHGEVSVVEPPPGVESDQLLYYHSYTNQPATYFSRSPLSPGESVLDRRELFELGQALAAVREHFADIYEPPAGYQRLPMDVEFKRVGQGASSTIELKQARPYPGRGM